MTDPSSADRGEGLLLDRDSPGSARRIAVAGFRALWRGRRVHVSTLDPDGAAADALERQGRLELDADGTVVGVHGLVAHETQHRIEHRDGAVHTWCALDAIGIPAAMMIDAIAVTRCPTCACELRVTLHAGEPEDAGEAVLWLPTGPCTHLVQDFCRNANLYCNQDHLDATVPTDLVGQPVTITEAAAIGRSAWSDIAPTPGEPREG
jgi:hypothetical protein